ncbi:mucin-2 protein [Marmoricola sp. URHB0036]|uniref:mucin-2 protein n=1 Tax=Marmoricola sp. URHB0036 TaxID=1298863 RepID=UPI0012DDDA4D|nr:mucin-2 protein [Marmoricola sp. URHB0036]
MPRGHSRGKHTLAPTRSASFHTVFRRRRLALVAAPLVTALAIGTGVATSGFARPDAPSRAASSIGAAAATDTHERVLGTTRSQDRVALINNRVPKATGKLWTTAPLDLRTEPREKARTAGLLETGKHVPVTGKRQNGYAEVIVGRLTRWVTDDYLSKSKERPPGSLGLVDRPCPGTSGVESGLTSGAVRVYRAVCNNFPQITQYGGYDAHGEHSSGRAIDIMTSDSSTGDQIAAFLQAHASELNLYDIIWQQHIWTPVRSSEGWRSMSDRGSETANHFDHVHVSVN